MLIQFFIPVFLCLAKAEAPPDRWCVLHPPTFNKKRLDCLKSANQTLFLRNILNDVENGKQSPPDLNAGNFISKAKFVDLFKRSILVFAVEEDEHAGYHVRFVFKDFPKHTFFAWVTYDNDSYKLEIIVDDGAEKETEKIRKRLHQKEFLPYWL
ncbi:MAG: hypothetical protein C5B49_08515 [Bdellovibrio sp.]|nr:MAG: hypothetical protein C5B49_08515 [Bdellovibrio sp.]